MSKSKGQFIAAVNGLLNAEKGAVSKSEIKEMVAYLGEVTQIFTSTDMNESDKAQTACGVAISPVQAAKCFEETLRTQIFVQGVAMAIEDCLKTNEVPVRILYAGTGPYATLLLPFLASREKLPLEITLLDIHEENINAVKSLIKHFDLERYQIKLVLGDATHWHPDGDDTGFDIIISETMTALLKREPQVFIFKHLVQYLTPGGVLIPEEVSLKTWLTKRDEKAQDDVLIGEFFCLDQARSRALNKGDDSCFSSELIIPDGDWADHVVKLTTDIRVYRHLCLHEGDCSLNIAFAFSPYDAVLTPNKPITFKYVQPQSPDFEVVFPKAEWRQSDFSLPLPEETGELGIVQIKRAFQRAYLIKRGEKVSAPEHEWQAELSIYDKLSVSSSEVIGKMYEVERFSDFEVWFSERVGPVKQEQVTALNQECLRRLQNPELCK
ncbi:class I SAM-dependent methyltransferase [Pseudoalteromonas luteoviolacea]|uniref:class I SAM-dependent methyltransferase n=1 Tax=Pseudoalteromonas luteoviolacea TaxID=43657 RepID=UPI0011506023|nr:class I SAM-dependent methyltransferase [Pseudoalteromonas luteoviolacea]TQF67939.1 class I SAM-dependent methyltransferase [Pseudoalteromonas luteoviolacea]